MLSLALFFIGYLPDILLLTYVVTFTFLSYQTARSLLPSLYLLVSRIWMLLMSVIISVIQGSPDQHPGAVLRGAGVQLPLNSRRAPKWRTLSISMIGAKRSVRWPSKCISGQVFTLNPPRRSLRPPSWLGRGHPSPYLSPLSAFGASIWGVAPKFFSRTASTRVVLRSNFLPQFWSHSSRSRSHDVLVSSHGRWSCGLLLRWLTPKS